MTSSSRPEAQEMLPCPRCGTHAEVVHASHIRCANIYNCDCETRLGIEAWNRRPASPGVRVPRELLQRIEGALTRHIQGGLARRLPVDKTDSDIVLMDIEKLLASPSSQGNGGWWDGGS